MTRQSILRLTAAIIMMASSFIPGGYAANEFCADIIQTTGSMRTEGNMCAKGTNTRMTINTKKGQQIVIARGDKKISWIITPAQKSYIEMTLPAASAANGTDEAQKRLDTIATKKELGEEMIDGDMCTKTQYTFKDKTGTMIQWISKSKKFPIRTETTTPQGKSITQMKNIRTTSVKDSEFAEPAGYKKMTMPDMSSMMKAFGGAGANAGKGAVGLPKGIKLPFGGSDSSGD